MSSMPEGGIRRLISYHSVFTRSELMQYARAEQQAIVLAISNGNDVTVEQLRWAIEQGYVALVNGDEVEITNEGWELMGA